MQPCLTLEMNEVLPKLRHDLLQHKLKCNLGQVTSALWTSVHERRNQNHSALYCGRIFSSVFWLSNAPNTILELQQMDAFLNCFLLKEYKFITLLLLLLSRFSHVRLCATP